MAPERFPPAKPWGSSGAPEALLGSFSILPLPSQMLSEASFQEAVRRQFLFSFHDQDLSCNRHDVVLLPRQLVKGFSSLPLGKIRKSEMGSNLSNFELMAKDFTNDIENCFSSSSVSWHPLKLVND